jgi:hypothetical protein
MDVAGTEYAYCVNWPNLSAWQRGSGLLPAAAGAARARHVAVLAVGLLLALAVAGCASLAAEAQTGSALEHAGYQNVSINVTSGSGEPAGGIISVSYSHGPSGSEQADVQRAEKIVWDTYPSRFGELAILIVSGGCAGPVCSSSSNVVAQETYSQLSAMFGPRPANLKLASTPSSLGVPAWAVVLCAVLVAGGVATAIVLPLTLGRRRKRRPQVQPGWPGWPPGPGGPPYPYWPAGPAQPPAPNGPPQPPSMPSPPSPA